MAKKCSPPFFFRLKLVFLTMAAGCNIIIFCSHLTRIHPPLGKSSLHPSRPLTPPRLKCLMAGTHPTVPSPIPQPHPPPSGME